MKKLLLALGIIFFFQYGIQFIAYAQVNNSSSKSELIQALENRSENERKISSNLYSKIFSYQEKLSKGMSVQKAMEVFDQEKYSIDNSNRLLILIRLDKDYSLGAEKVRTVVHASDGIIKEKI